MAIEVSGLVRKYGAHPALDGVSLQVADGELVALLGPSGSGKTTLLRAIAGLEPLDAGRVTYDGQDVTDSPARQRGVGFVFQHYALFGHMDVFENVAFALRVRKRPDAEVQARVGELLDLVQLGGFAKRYPDQLSGGQRQRVALARALASEPRVLLLDEPFSALDAQVRKDLRRWLRSLHDRIRTTCLFVTHDQEEAFELADRVVVFHKGQIEQDGSPREVWRQPKTAFVLQFLGHVNLLSGVQGPQGWQGPGGLGWIGRPQGPAVAEGPAVLGVRHRDLSVRQKAQAAESDWLATVERIATSGWRCELQLRLSNSELLTAEVSCDELDELDLRPGDAAALHVRHGYVYGA